MSCMNNAYTLPEFEHAAQEMAQQLVPTDTATIIALHGDLGAGKTTFTQTLARTLGVTEDIVSPTFVIQKRYPLEAQRFEQLIHIDAYRLTKAEELAVLGWDDIARDSRNLIVIEWAENVADILPSHTQHMYFEYIDEHTRSISHEL